MKIHFIAIGGSAMHNLAIALKRKGYDVSGSDDEIFEPSRSRLREEGLLPEKTGWDSERISSDMDAVILGMHARKDNPELEAAEKLGVKIYSYPEYLYEQTRDKTRVVIGGSHGKTTITAILLHVFRKLGIEADYMVGAKLEGMDCMVRLSENNKLVVFEGDEYLSSPIDRRPKFHLYRPHIALLTGIAWDHINVFPTFDNYVEQFRKFIDLIEQGGKLIYFEGDETLKALASERNDLDCVPYNKFESFKSSGNSAITYRGKAFQTELFGDHNMANLRGAMEVGRALGVEPEKILRSISDFKGASKRLEKVIETNDFAFFKDFAHAPSKLKATTEAVKNRYPERELIACMELHTFSSLNKTFLPHYRGAMERADRALVYFSPEVVAHKRLEPLSPEEVENAFGGQNVEVFTDSSEMAETLERIRWEGKNLLMMSSGNFDGIDFEELAGRLT